MRLLLLMLVCLASFSCRSRSEVGGESELSGEMEVPDMQGENRENAIKVLQDFTALVKARKITNGLIRTKYPSSRLIKLFRLTPKELRTLTSAKKDEADVECWSDNSVQSGIYCRFTIYAKQGFAKAYSNMSTVKGKPSLQIGEKGRLAYMIAKLSSHSQIDKLQVPGGMDICQVKGFWVKKVVWLNMHSLYMNLESTKIQSQAAARKKKSTLTLNLRTDDPDCFGTSKYTYRDSQRRFTNSL